MANWDTISSSGNVEDRRGFGPVAIGGGISLTGLVLLLALNYLSGGSLIDVANQLNTAPVVQQQAPSQQFEGKDSYEVFAGKVLGSNNEAWSTIFKQHNQTYAAPKLVLFRTATDSACGTATSRVGPHYCPFDRTIYLDETFFDELTHRFGAKGGDVAQAYVISHEVGHHVQNQLRQLNNKNSVAVELQADCYAGVWANSLKDRSVFEPGEINEAIDAAAAVGDDRIQAKVQGYTDPETWTHGSSSQRVGWFNKGYDSGSLEACDTSIL